MSHWRHPRKKTLVDSVAIFIKRFENLI